VHGVWKGSEVVFEASAEMPQGLSLTWGSGR
jgi:hypothetical protein